MSFSSSASLPSWPQHGPVPMLPCPDCERVAPLVRLTSKSNKNGNRGREFVKCESKPEGQVRSHDFALFFFFLFALKFRVHLFVSDCDEMRPFRMAR